MKKLIFYACCGVPRFPSRDTLMSFFVLAMALLVTVQASAQQWSGIIDPSRAPSEAHGGGWAGAGATIPIRTTICTTLGTAGQVPTFVQSVTLANVTSAISGCASGQVVFLNPGTYNLSAGITFGSGKSNVTLRGSGADQTIINVADDDGCRGFRAAICVASSDTNFGDAPSNTANWTAGFAQGATTITLSSVANLKVGNPIILDQANDASDAGGVLVEDGTGTLTATNPCGTAPCGTTGPFSLEGNGGGAQRDGKEQSQTVIVASCDGISTPGHACTSGTNITITPGLYMPNWGTNTTGAWWATGPITNDGVENLSIDSTALSTSDAGIEIFNCHNCWVRGVRSIDSGRAHVQILNSDHVTVRDSYLFLTHNSQSQSYGVEIFNGSDILIENNVIQAVASPLMVNGSSESSVLGYNFAINNYYTASNGYNLPCAYNHTAGNDEVLFEGNDCNQFHADLFHGTRQFVSLFRNRFSGVSPVCQTDKTLDYFHTTFGACNNNFSAVVFDAYARFFTAIANVLGTSGINLSYQNATKDIWDIGNGDNNGTVTVNPDPNVLPTLFRYGNYDTVTAGVKFDSTEVPTALTGVQAPFSNAVPATHNFPASFYQPAKPSWWPAAKPWPAIGPDVTGGDIANVGGHAYSIPAKDCYINVMLGNANGTGGPYSFNADTCYPPNGAAPQTVPSPSPGLFATVSGLWYFITMNSQTVSYPGGIW